jgi:transposase
MTTHDSLHQTCGAAIASDGGVMQTLIECGCRLDVHQATVVACLLMIRRDGEVQKQMRTFGTTTRELVSLREWLVSEGCTHVAW